jgi:hypothetical protein
LANFNFFLIHTQHIHARLLVLLQGLVLVSAHEDDVFPGQFHERLVIGNPLIA